jgi:hypothetical protein
VRRGSRAGAGRPLRLHRRGGPAAHAGEQARMPDADTVWLIEWAELTAAAARGRVDRDLAGGVHCLPPRDGAATAAVAFHADSAEIARQIGRRALAESDHRPSAVECAGSAAAGCASSRWWPRSDELRLHPLPGREEERGRPGPQPPGAGRTVPPDASGARRGSWRSAPVWGRWWPACWTGRSSPPGSTPCWTSIASCCGIPATWLSEWATARGLPTEPLPDGLRLGDLRVRLVEAELGSYLEAGHGDRPTC